MKLLFLLSFFLASPFCYASSSLESEFQSILNSYKVNNALFIVKDFNGKTLLEVTQGSLKTTDNVPVASASKWISAAVALRVLENKKIPLDMPIGTYLKKMNHLNLGKLKYMITIRQLLNFQSGIADNVKCMYISMFRMDTKKCATRILEKSELRDKAGFEYGSQHMALLGYVLEHITGKNWNEIFEQEFKKPFAISGDEITYYGGPKHRRGLENPLVAGGLVISTGAYLKFLDMIVNKGNIGNKKYLSEEMVNEMLRDQFPSKKTKIFNSPYSNLGVNPHYALGNWVESESVNSSAGAFGFYPWIDKKEKIYAIFSTEGERDEYKRSYKIVSELREKIIKKLQRN